MLAFLWVAMIVDIIDGKCLNATEIRDKSVLPLTGKDIFSLDGLWYVVSAFDATQPPYYGECSCTHYNLTVHSNFEEDNLYQTYCTINLPIPFKGHFDPNVAGLWYELTSYNATDQVDIIDYQMVTYKNDNSETESSQTLIRYSCIDESLGLWTTEVWARKKDVPQSEVDSMLLKFPMPIRDTTLFHMYNQSECTK